MIAMTDEEWLQAVLGYSLIIVPSLIGGMIGKWFARTSGRRTLGFWLGALLGVIGVIGVIIAAHLSSRQQARSAENYRTRVIAEQRMLAYLRVGPIEQPVSS